MTKADRVKYRELKAKVDMTKGYTGGLTDGEYDSLSRLHERSLKAVKLISKNGTKIVNGDEEYKLERERLEIMDLHLHSASETYDLRTEGYITGYEMRKITGECGC